MQLQQPIQISLVDNVINLSIPNALKVQFSILNITLRPVIIFPIISHQDQMFVTCNRKIRILQAFESIQLQIGLKSMSLSINELIYPRMRIYYWQVKNFCDEDEILLEKDEAVLESEGMFGRRQVQGCEQKEGEISQQQFQLMVGLEKRKKVILQKYRQKMFQPKNTSLQIYTCLKSTKDNSTINSYVNNQQQDLQQESSQEQQSFSQLLFRDFDINIQIEDSLHLSALYGQSSSRQYYLLENIIRPQKLQLLQQEKQKELENIEKKLFQVLEKLGNVKEIDRLRGDGRQERVEQEVMKGGSQRRIGLMDSPQPKTKFTSNQSLQLKIPQERITLQRYLIEYKSPILQNTSTQPQVLSCHFIQITTAKHYYLFRLSKILSYDFYYRVRTISEDGTRKNSGLDYTRRGSHRRGKLPIIVDLRTVKIDQIRGKKVKERVQNNVGKDQNRKNGQNLQERIVETLVNDKLHPDNLPTDSHSPIIKLPLIQSNSQQPFGEKSGSNFQQLNSRQKMLHQQKQHLLTPSVPHQQQYIQQAQQIHQREDELKTDNNDEVIERKQLQEMKIDEEKCIDSREEQKIDNSANIQFQEPVDPQTKQHVYQLQSEHQQSQLKSQPEDDPIKCISLPQNLPKQNKENNCIDRENNISLVEMKQQQDGLEKMERQYKEVANEIQLENIIDEDKQPLGKEIEQRSEVINNQEEIMRENIQSIDLLESQVNCQHLQTKLIQQPSALLKEQQSSLPYSQPKRQTISINQSESLKETETLQKQQLSMIESNRKGHSFEGEYNTRETLCKLSQEVNNKVEVKVQISEVQSEGEEGDTVDMLSGIRHININPLPTHIHKDSNNLSSTTSSPSNLSPPKKKPSLSQSFSHSLTSTHHHQQHHPPKYIDEFIIYPDPILAFHISYQVDSTQQDKNLNTPATVYLLFRTHLLYYPIGNPQLKTIIPLDPMKPQDTINFKTVITPYKNQQIIAANGCYIYWISLTEKLSQWKYCQRKEIYSLQVIEEMGLLMVGGKNFSKLSYFGKETSRSNLKVYSCSKRSHLFTYDIPINEPVGNVMEMKYVTTPPTGGKLLCVYTNHNDQFKRLLFFRIRAFNIIQVYGKIQLHQIGIQSILGMKYNYRTARLVILEQVDSQHSSLKKLKLKSMYQKVEVLTECIKMELGNYESFQLGGEKAQQWYSLIQKGKILSYVNRSDKLINNPEIVKMQKQYHIDAVFDVPEGNVLVKGYDFVMIKKKIAHTHQMNK